MAKSYPYTKKTIELLESRGFTCGVVERFIPMRPHGIRVDLFGFIDIIAMKPEEGLVGVQSFGKAFSAHKRKILLECKRDAIRWLDSGARILLIGWEKKPHALGSRKLVYVPREEFVSLSTLGEIRPPVRRRL